MPSLRMHVAAAATTLCVGAPLWQVSTAAQTPDSDSIAGSLIQVRVYASRANPTAGSGLGVQADIENRSSTVVYLRSQDIRLTLPPELQGPLVREREGLPALLPTESEGKDGQPSFIALKPNDTYTVFWRAEPSDPTPKPVRATESSFIWLPNSPILWPIIDNELNFMFFAPGEYRLVANVKYWTDFNFNGTNYRTVRQDAVLQVAAPIFVILVGAAVGGLIAYFVFPDLRPRTKRSIPIPFLAVSDNGWAAELSAVAGSVFLSVITTILLSRIAESQFLVRVTVNDVWGAIAIGFIANFAGYKALAPYLKSHTSPDGDDGKDTASASKGDAGGGNSRGVGEMTDRDIEVAISGGTSAKNT